MAMGKRAIKLIEKGERYRLEKTKELCKALRKVQKMMTPRDFTNPMQIRAFADMLDAQLVVEKALGIEYKGDA